MAKIVSPLAEAERPSHYGRKLVKDFDEAAQTYAFKGTYDSLQHDSIDKRYASTKRSLENYIRKLEIKAGVPSSSKAITGIAEEDRTASQSTTAKAIADDPEWRSKSRDHPPRLF